MHSLLNFVASTILRALCKEFLLKSEVNISSNCRSIKIQIRFQKEFGPITIQRGTYLSWCDLIKTSRFDLCNRTNCNLYKNKVICQFSQIEIALTRQINQIKSLRKYTCINLRQVLNTVDYICTTIL